MAKKLEKEKLSPGDNNKKSYWNIFTSNKNKI